MKKKLIPFFLFLSSLITQAQTPQKEDEEFSEFEVRVISPRYFNKVYRLEVGTQITAITNQTFIYTYLMSGILSFHLSESLGIEGSFSYGDSIDKSDKILLASDFGIETQIIRTEMIMSGNVIWTPMYGKYQLRSGHLVYFDTFVSAGAALTGIRYNFDHCALAKDSGGNSITLNREPILVNYPTFLAGLGQRFFLDKKQSIRWDMRTYLFSFDAADSACNEGGESQLVEHENITLQVGYSRFL